MMIIFKFFITGDYCMKVFPKCEKNPNQTVDTWYIICIAQVEFAPFCKFEDVVQKVRHFISSHVQ